MPRLANRVTLITGGTEGIGRSLALAMCTEGAQVVVSGRSQAKGDRLLAEHPEAQLTFLAADATKPDHTERAVAEVIARHGRVDILVNNAGGGAGEFAYLHELSDAGWMRGMELNLHSAFWATRAVLPHMLSRGYGRIINVSSVEGKLATMASIAPYIVSKHALNGLTKATAAEYGPHGITCNAICPGLVDLPRDRPGAQAVSEATGTSYAHVVDSFVAETKTKRLTGLAEINAAALMLASEEAAGITGVLLSVDGGMSPW